MADIGILQAAIAPVRRLWRRPAAVEIAPKVGDDEQDARAHFRDGLVKRRGGDGEGEGGEPETPSKKKRRPRKKVGGAADEEERKERKEVMGGSSGGGVKKEVEEEEEV